MYTHFEPLEFGKVAQIQAFLLRPKASVKKENTCTERVKSGQQKLTLVKMAGDNLLPRRKRA